MPLKHGEDIGAALVEREIGSWSAVRFARLGNALAWAAAWPSTQTVPAYTERVDVADGGIDAEWSSSFDAINSGALLRAGLNVFQYKKREVVEATRASIAATLARELKGEILKVEERRGSRLSSYAFFTNVDLTTAQQEQIRLAILEGVDGDRVHARVVGAAQLAALLNNLPHIRSAFFVTSVFRTWNAAWEAHQSAVSFGESALFGREEEFGELAAWIADPGIRIIGLSGSHMMGKTRLALEATRKHDVSTVEALDRQSLSLADLKQLAVQGRTTIVMVNDPDPDLADQLAKDVLSEPQLKLLLCVATADAAPAPNFGRDSRVKHMALTGLKPEKATDLLRGLPRRLDFSLESWVVGNAGGVPGILLAAAHVGADLRTDGENFVDQVAGAFEREVKKRLSADEFNALRALSLMSHVGIEGKAAPEAATISKYFSTDVNRLLNAVPALRSAGIARVGGSYVEIVPRMLADRLAAGMIKGRLAEVRRTLADLPAPGRKRFLRRLVTLTGSEARQFWEDVLGDNGPFATMAGLTENAELLELAAAANGTRAAAVVSARLSGATVEERKKLCDGARRKVLHSIEEMLFRVPTSEAAMRSLSLLADAENEKWANNATGILREISHPLHSQMPLPLTRRLVVLRDLLDRRSPEQLALIAIEAGAGAFEQQSHVLRHSIAGTPFDIPKVTWKDVWKYLADLLDLLEEATNDPRDAVRRAAASRLPKAAAMMAARGSDQGLPALRRVVERVVAGDTDFQVTELANSIAWCRHALGTDAHGGAAKNADAIAELDALSSALRNATFVVRVRLWMGGWFHDLGSEREHTKSMTEGLRSLAAEAAKSPEVLTQDIVAWMLSDAAQLGFWTYLGELDANGAHVDLVQSLAKRANGAGAFISYLIAWNARDPSTAKAFFEFVARDSATLPRAKLFGALELDEPDDGAARILQMMRDGQLEASSTANTLMSTRWLSSVSDQALVGVLTMLAGQDYEGAPEIPHLVGYRCYLVKLTVGPLADFFWRYLEARPTSARQGDYHSDELAAKLTQLDPDRGFDLLKRAIRDTRSGSRWDPLSVHSSDGPPFWKALCTIDARRAVTIALDAIVDGDAITVEWHIPKLIDLHRDEATLRQYSQKGEEHASAVVAALIGGKVGFWPIAFHIVELYPHSESLRKALEQRVLQMGEWISGAQSDHYARCLANIDIGLAVPGISETAKAWLGDFAQRLQSAATEERRREADEEIND